MEGLIELSLNGRLRTTGSRPKETSQLHFCLLGDFQGIVNFDARISHRTFPLGMAQ